MVVAREGLCGAADVMHAVRFVVEMGMVVPADEGGDLIVFAEGGGGGAEAGGAGYGVEVCAKPGWRVLGVVVGPFCGVYGAGVVCAVVCVGGGGVDGEGGGLGDGGEGEGGGEGH